MQETVMSPEDFMKIGEKIKKTNEDTTPFAVVKEGKLSVVGDANQTEVKKNDYTIKFRFPKELFPEGLEKATSVGPYYVVAVEYKGVSITPRNDVKIMDAIFKILPFFNKLKEDGGIEELSNEEILSIYAYANDEVHLAIYNLVATFLGINDQMGEYMLPFSVLTALNQIIDTHPEVFNEADVFFG